MARRGEGGAGELLGIQPVGRPLRRIAPLRQRAGQRLGGEVVAEAAVIAQRAQRRGALRTFRTHLPTPYSQRTGVA